MSTTTTKTDHTICAAPKVRSQRLSCDDDGVAGDSAAAEVASPSPSPAPATETADTSAHESADGGNGRPGEGEPPQPSSPGAPSADVEALKARIAELEAATSDGKTLKQQLAEQAGRLESMQAALVATRKAATVAHLESAGVPTDVRADVAAMLGDVDVSSPDGARKVQEFLEARPSLVVRSTAGERVTVAAESEIEAWANDPLIDLDHYRAEMAKIARGSR